MLDSFPMTIVTVSHTNNATPLQSPQHSQQPCTCGMCVYMCVIQVSQLEGEVGAAQERARAGWSPTASEFTALEAKLDGVCRELAARDAKWRGVLEDARSLYGVQVGFAVFVGFVSCGCCCFCDGAGCCC